MELPDSELAVMDLLWAEAPRTSEGLIAALQDARGWQPSTVKTLLARLVRRGAVRAERDARRFSYWPLWEREQYLNQATGNFLDTLFGGQLTPMLAHLSQHRTLKPEERDALSKLLKDLEQRHGS